MSADAPRVDTVFLGRNGIRLDEGLHLPVPRTSNILTIECDDGRHVADAEAMERQAISRQAAASQSRVFTSRCGSTSFITRA